MVTLVRRLLEIHSFLNKEVTMKIRVVFVILILASSLIGFAQGTFQDLYFEQATIVPLGSGYSAASAFPGWQAIYGTTPTSIVGLDAISIGAAEISLVNDNPSEGLVPLQGNFSAYLFSNPTTTTTLSQTGLVPGGTESIQMDVVEMNGGTFAVTLGGQSINMVPLQTFPNYTLYGANVSAWSGQTANLSITENVPSNPAVYPDELQLDNITFSTQTVPEPSPLVLTGAGALVFALYRCFAPKR
jgi:hypothetical protein